MIQRPIAVGKIIYLLVSLLLLASCERPQTPAPVAPSPDAPSRVRVASLVPSATDLLLAMDAADHLVAVSNYDPARPPIDTLPRVGDYQTIDWERLGELRPNIMIVFQDPERLEAGVRQRADSLGIKLVNVRTETIEDIFSEMQRLGDLIGESDKATAARDELQGRLDAVRQRVAQLPPVPTLIIMQEGGFGTVGPGKFIDQSLTIAGGRNVVTTEGWPTLDREQVLATGAEAVIELLPDAPPQVMEQSRARWKALGDLPAVRNNRVYTLNDWYLLRSGDHVVEMAEKFAQCLHPQQFPSSPATQP